LSDRNVAGWFHDRNALRALVHRWMWHTGSRGNRPTLSSAPHILRDVESRT
jgi:hypothetical protein